MLSAIGVASEADLFSNIPASVRRGAIQGLPPAQTESELRAYFRAASDRNHVAGRGGWLSFLGAGAYEHYIPSVVDALASRGEFVTAYTPYQPEVSQGTLQAVFEFQSMVANLFGMDVANASMYDGASAAAEAVLMALRLRDGHKVLISKGVHPEYRATVIAYLKDAEVEISDLEIDDQGRTVASSLGDGVAAVLVQQPNAMGIIENLTALSEITHRAGGLLAVTTTEAMAFGLLKSPGSQGADIVAGEGQSFGNPVSFGGPYVGLFATKTEHIRQLPGRVVGKTVDRNGRDGYVLTLATREQHIRRERATSNICTNHSLCALRACITMATLGTHGMRDIAVRNAWMARELAKKLKEIKGVSLTYGGPFFNEFCVKLPISSEAFLDSMEKDSIFAGVPLSKWDHTRTHEMLVAVTETKNVAELDRYVAAAKKVL